MEEADANGKRVTRARGDSKLVVEQTMGKWKVKKPSLQKYAEKAKALRKGCVVLEHVPREENREADQLANAGCRGMNQSTFV